MLNYNCGCPTGQDLTFLKSHSLDELIIVLCLDEPTDRLLDVLLICVAVVGDYVIYLYFTGDM